MTLSGIRVDIISDVVCPWCIIGYNQLKAAADAMKKNLDVHWHPFELNPLMPPEGQILSEHIIEKYGIPVETSAKTRKTITKLGAEHGFIFNYKPDTRIVNTLQAHKLIKWAACYDKQHDLKMTLFRRYFTEGQNVSKPVVLLEAVEEVYLDTSEASRVMESKKLSDEVRSESQIWKSKGVRAVPTVVFDDQQQISGAPGVQKYLNFIEARFGGGKNMYIPEAHLE